MQKNKKLEELSEEYDKKIHAYDFIVSLVTNLVKVEKNYSMQLGYLV